MNYKKIKYTHNRWCFSQTWSIINNQVLLWVYHKWLLRCRYKLQRMKLGTLWIPNLFVKLMGAERPPIKIVINVLLVVVGRAARETYASTIVKLNKIGQMEQWKSLLVKGVWLLTPAANSINSDKLTEATKISKSSPGWLVAAAVSDQFWSHLFWR